MPTPIALFVYGTLKQGGRNFHVAQQAGWVRSEQAFVEGFSLHHLPASQLRIYPYPAMVEGGGRVQGEIQWFEDMELALKLLDELEDEGGEYRRIQTTAFVDRGESHSVWVYVYSHPQALAAAGAMAVAGEIWRPEDFLGGTV